MLNKNLLSGIVFILVTVVCTGCSFMKKEEPAVVSTENVIQKEEIDKKKVEQPQTVSKPVAQQKIKTDLYSKTPYDLPLASVVEISKLPSQMKKTIDETLEEARGFYFVKYDKDLEKAIILLQNPISETKTFARHSLEFAQVSKDGTKTLHSLDHTGSIENENDVWTFDETVDYKRPLKHVAFDEAGNIVYVESWNYSENNPVKYEMKNSDNKILSILKETHDSDSNYRQEHIFYDNDGKTSLSISANYDGANLTRFTYYNKAEENDSMSIMSQYEDGVKTSETIYNKDYQIQNTLKSEYSDGVRKSITVLDKDSNEVEKLLD